MPDDAFEVQTAEANVRVSILARDLENPWSLVFLPDGSMLITENRGQLRLIENGELQQFIGVHSHVSA